MGRPPAPDGPASVPGPAPVIPTERLDLRAFDENDAGALHELLSGDDVLRYFPTTSPLDSKKVQRMICSMQDHWKTHGYGVWAVEVRDDSRLAGRCGLQLLPETNEVEIDFLLGRPFWGLGYATEAARSALAWGFTNRKLAEVVGIVHRQNAGSIQVLEKIGMVSTGERDYFGMPCFRYIATAERSRDAI